MGKRIWVDRRRARAGALVALAGLVLLLATLALRVDADDSNCASMADPDRARECVAEGAQALDRDRLVLMLAIAGAMAVVAIGGTIVIRARRRVLDVADAAELLGSDAEGIRSLIADGDLVSITSDGRTYVAATDVERMGREPGVANGGALPRGV